MKPKHKISLGMMGYSISMGLLGALIMSPGIVSAEVVNDADEVTMDSLEAEDHFVDNSRQETYELTGPSIIINVTEVDAETQEKYTHFAVQRAIQLGETLTTETLYDMIEDTVLSNPYHDYAFIMEYNEDTWDGE